MDKMPLSQKKQSECSICHGPFSIENEGGIEGFIGIIPVAFCPTCKAGIYDLAEMLWGKDDDEE